MSYQARSFMQINSVIQNQIESINIFIMFVTAHEKRCLFNEVKNGSSMPIKGQLIFAIICHQDAMIPNETVDRASLSCIIMAVPEPFLSITIDQKSIHPILSNGKDWLGLATEDV